MLKKIAPEYIKDHRGPDSGKFVKLIVPQKVIDALKPDSPLHAVLESPEDIQHRAWLQNITDRVNRRLGNQ